MTVPVVVGAVAGVVLSPLQLLGVGMAGLAAMAAGARRRCRVGGRALVPPGSPRSRSGAWYVLLDLAAKAGDRLWGLVISRATSSNVIGAIALVGGRAADCETVAALVALAGLLDVRRQRASTSSGARRLVGLGRRAHRALYPLDDVARRNSC